MGRKVRARPTTGGEQDRGGVKSDRSKTVTGLDAELERAMFDLQQLREYYQGSPRQGTLSGTSTQVRDEATSNQDEASVSKEKLDIAEAVIRKLYERNLELEKSLKKAEKRIEEAKTIAQVGGCKSEKIVENNSKPTRIEASQPVVGTGAQTIARNSSPNSSILTQLHSQTEEHLKAMLESRNHALEQQQSIIETLKAKLAERGHGRKKAATATPSTSPFMTPLVAVDCVGNELEAARRKAREAQANLRDANARATHYAQQAESMRVVQGLRLESKVDGRKLAPLLTEQLDSQANEHRREKEHFNEKLTSLEKENSKLHVQTKLYQAQVKKFSEELKQRDAIEAQIQRKMLDIITHMKQLEADNLSLRQSRE